MLATTRAARSRAVCSRLMWPACRLPIVGTSATLNRAARQARTCARTASMVLTVCMAGRSEAVLGGRVAPRLDGLHVAVGGFLWRSAAGHEVAHEAWLASGGDIQHVIKHQDLPVG